MKRFLLALVMAGLLISGGLAVAGGSITPERLWSEFRANESAFKQNYGQDRIRMHGEVTSIGGGRDGPKVSFSAGGKSTLTCQFDDLPYTQWELDMVSLGETLRFSGVYDRNMQATMFFEDCRLR